jgi:hypothetical protein
MPVQERCASSCVPSLDLQPEGCVSLSFAANSQSHESSTGQTKDGCVSGQQDRELRLSDDSH